MRTTHAATDKAAFHKVALAEVAIIGAGTAGCLIAHLLDKAGFNCLLLEKSRGVGGRCSRRRITTDSNTNTSYGIDLGGLDFAPAKSTNPLLKDILDAWTTQGSLSEWVKSVSRFDNYPASHPDDHTQTSETLTTLSGTPSMNTWHSNVANDINILTQSKVCQLERVDDCWHLFDENNQPIVVANALVITAPPEQTRDLLKTASAVTPVSLPDTLPLESLPQYVCAIGFAQPLALDVDVYQNGHASLHRAIRENSKPGRVSPDSLEEVWVLHSTYEWAQEQNHGDSNTAAIELADAFCQHFGIQAKAEILTSHYWRMAKYKSKSLQSDAFFWDEDLNVGCCGDWLGGGGTVGALNSALALHEAIELHEAMIK